VDQALAREEFACSGARGDAELPIRIERLTDYPLWARWCDEYGIKSLVLEVKNMASPARVRDIQQTLAYLVVAKLGRLGMVVSRAGFTRAAIKYLGAIAQSDRYLILPLAHEELRDLAYVSSRAGACMAYLRRKATVLQRAA
jgi:hypothetical protein